MSSILSSESSTWRDVIMLFLLFINSFQNSNLQSQKRGCVGDSVPKSWWGRASLLAVIIMLFHDSSKVHYPRQLCVYPLTTTQVVVVCAHPTLFATIMTSTEYLKLTIHAPWQIMQTLTIYSCTLLCTEYSVCIVQYVLFKSCTCIWKR